LPSVNLYHCPFERTAGDRGVRNHDDSLGSRATGRSGILTATTAIKAAITAISVIGSATAAASRSVRRVPFGAISSKPAITVVIAAAPAVTIGTIGIECSAAGSVRAVTARGAACAACV